MVHEPAAVSPPPSALSRAAGAAAAGGLTAAAFPSLNWWPLAAVGTGLLWLSVRGARPRTALLLGMVFGYCFFLPHLRWSGVYVGWLPWVALATVESVYMALLAVGLSWAWRAPGGGAVRALAVGGLWVAQEAARGRWPFGGLPWGRLAFSQASAPTLGLAALGGAPLVTAVVAAAGALLAWGALAVRDGRRPGPALGWLLAAAALTSAGLLVPRPTGAQRSVLVAAVQGNVPRAGLAFNAQRRAVLDNHVRATLALAQRTRLGGGAPASGASAGPGGVPRPDLVIWPENSSDIDPLRNTDAAERIDAAVDAVQAPVLVGAVLQEPAGHLSNAGIVWSPGSGAGARYVKRHPAPFAEYIPFRRFFRHFSSTVDLVRADFVPGHASPVLAVGPARVGDVICFEVGYDALVRDAVRRGADLLAVQTNNATFGYTDESVQQLAMSRLRAVETGRGVVHVSTVGVSAIIAPDGTVLTRSAHFRQDVLTARVPLRDGTTAAVRLGLLPEVVLATLGIALALAGARAGTARRKEDP